MSKTVYMMMGLPGCGKSTRAKEMLAQFGYGNAKIVNKDALRAMLDDGHWSGPNEKFVLQARDSIIVNALGQGKHVIVDDTNLAPKHIERLRQLAREHDAAFEVIDMTEVPVETCIERDLKRLNSVGATVIRKMHRDYLAPKPPVVAYDPALPDCIIVDVDGTIAIMNGRGPFEWHRVGEDRPNQPVIEIVWGFRNKAHLLYVSGRDEVCQRLTEDWITGNVGPAISTTRLFMRPAGDMRDDRIIKREIYEREIQGKYNVLFVLDDRNKVVQQWREMGLPCFQVADGDF